MNLCTVNVGEGVMVVKVGYKASPAAKALQLVRINTRGETNAALEGPKI